MGTNELPEKLDPSSPYELFIIKILLVEAKRYR